MRVARERNRPESQPGPRGEPSTRESRDRGPGRLQRLVRDGLTSNALNELEAAPFFALFDVPENGIEVVVKTSQKRGRESFLKDKLGSM